VDKAESALCHGCHLFVADLLPPSRFDPQGVHGEIWKRLGQEEDDLPEGNPLTLASYEALPMPEAFLEHLAVGESLPEMPLFLERGIYINLPLESSYMLAYRGMPEYWRGVIEGRELTR